jgi:hypothetical protein
MEVVVGGVRIPPRPQQLGGLVDVQAVLGGEGEQLDQRLRLANTMFGSPGGVTVT